MTTQMPNTEDAHLPVFSAAALLKGDSKVGDELYKTCVEVGFFYLDFNDVETKPALEHVRGFFNATKDLYDLPLEEKLEFENSNYGPEKLCGYKPAGNTTGPVDGKRDGFESWMIPNDGLFNLKDYKIPFVGPEILKQRKQVFTEGVTDVHNVGLAVLSALSDRLVKDGINVDLVTPHKIDQLSTSGLGLLKYESYNKELSKNIGHIAHTDVGTLSFVFSEVGGLQVLMPQTDDWSFVPPKPGHAIVNVGDSLTFLSGGKLRSCLHRVIPHVDQETRTKYTCVYLQRPTRDTPMTDSLGKQWRSEDWHNRKFKVFRGTLDDQKQSEVLNGRHGYIGHWAPTTNASASTVS